METPAHPADRDESLALRQSLVDTLVSTGQIRSPHVEAAFRAVPRHLFVPDVSLERAYRNDVIVVKEHEGVALSSSSQPGIMALMLELLDLRPGQRVLEIGAATGYNAALLAHIVGEAGTVVSMDIDDDLVQQARVHLATARYGRVQVVSGDGGFGYAQMAPYDRIVVTVGTDDLAPAWHGQLAAGGRLLLPLGLTALDCLSGYKLLIAFDHVDDHLESRGHFIVIMVPLRGAFARAADGLVPVGPAPSISAWAGQPVNGEHLFALLSGPSRDLPTGVAIPQFMAQLLRLWVALHDLRFCELFVAGTAVDRGLVPALLPYPRPVAHTCGLIEAGTLCVLTRRGDQRVADSQNTDAWGQQAELSVRCYGPDTALAERLREHVLAYLAAGPPGITAYGRDAAWVPSAEERIIELPSARLALTW
jgi:protein-L-isoaspartate(D-aspartate) O-methyltransferase